MPKGDIVRKVIELAEPAKTYEDLFRVLAEVAHGAGGMVAHFPQEERSQVLMQLVEIMGTALQVTSKGIGEPSNVQILVGKK